MMKTIYLLVAAAAVVALIIVALQKSPAEPEVLGIPLPASRGSTELGIATLIGLENQTKVVINMSGGFSQTYIQPVHIHDGSCENLGAIKYPLNDVANGISATIIDVPLGQIQKELPLAINIHLSNDQLGVSVSCGDIVF
ncbi:MAG: hypothetical protein HYT03_02585 [Candidatus Harrisonbacteria bacterium]|nr:hypothetical protein [Candidatus Harrisonbacteria bacterium]